METSIEGLAEIAGHEGIILSGSPSLSAHDEDGAWSRGILDLGVPVLGFCFGHQEIAKHYGGSVELTRREYGAATLHIAGRSPLFEGLAEAELRWLAGSRSSAGRTPSRGIRPRVRR